MIEFFSSYYGGYIIGICVGYLLCLSFTRGPRR